MTCIVGYIEKKKVYIGGDSLGSNGYSKTNRKDVKVFAKDKMIFGYTTSYRMGQLLRYKFNIPIHNSNISDYEYMCTKFIDELILCLKSNNYAHEQNNVIRGGEFLVGYRNNLYKIEGDFQVGMSSLKYDAAGSGEDFALGAMYAIKNQEISPEERIKIAIKAASEFSTSVGGPIKIVSI